MKIHKIKFYISPNGLFVKLDEDREYLVSGVKAIPIVDITTKKRRKVLIFN